MPLNCSYIKLSVHEFYLLNIIRSRTSGKLAAEYRTTGDVSSDDVSNDKQFRMADK